MAAAYAAFANGGIYIKPQYVNKIEFSDGRVQEYAPEETRAMSEVTAYMMTDILKTVLYSGGTGTTAYIASLNQAGKSGTSNYTDEEYTIIEAEHGVSPDSVGLMAPDEMFVGYTPRYSMAVWTGYHNRMTPLYGDDLRIAQRVYRAMMTYLDDYSGLDWKMPDGLYRSGGYLYRGNYSPPQQQWYVPSSTSSSFPSSLPSYSSSSSEVVAESSDASSDTETEASTDTSTSTDSADE